MGIQSDVIDELRTRIDELENAIRTHRDQKGDDRCWLDDLELYKVLNDGLQPDNSVGDKVEMLKNCERYIDRRCTSGKWPSYEELRSIVIEVKDEYDHEGDLLIGTLNRLERLVEQLQ